MGQGSLYASSKKQKLNTKSSTEAELVGAGDFLSQVIWTANFLRAQGYEVVDNILYQDNQSAMKLERKRSTINRSYVSSHCYQVFFH